MPEPSPRVAAIVPNYNGREMLRECLDSLMAQDHLPDEIIVVDNGSADGSVDMLRSDYPGVRVIALERNMGFSVANNIASRQTGCDLLLLVNNDCIAPPEWTSVLLGALEDDVAAVASSMRSVRDMGILDSAGGEIDDMAFIGDRGHGRPACEFDRRTEVLFPCGGAALIRRAALEDGATIFWEKLFIYGEDGELGVRLWSRGWRVVYEPKAVILHKHSATCSRAPLLKETRCVRNRIMLIRRHMPRRKFARYMMIVLLWQLLWAFSSLARLRLTVFRGIVTGTLQGLFECGVERFPDSAFDKLILRFAEKQAKGFPRPQLAAAARRLLEG